MFILFIKLLYLIHLSLLRLYTLCFRILIVSLNTTFSHFFTKCLVMEMWFKVLEKSWNPIGQHAYDPCLTIFMFPRFSVIPFLLLWHRNPDTETIYYSLSNIINHFPSRGTHVFNRRLQKYEKQPLEVENK